jgi:peptidoglycan/LPS O-acetylase OafA/YrhL
MKPRDDAIDGLRGLAILAVLGCHMSKLFSSWNLCEHDFWQGACGAHLLLIISGFAMALVVAKTPDLRAFIIGRLTRVYPVYAVSILISATVVYLLHPPMYGCTWIQVTANLSMCQSWLGQAELDGAIWLTGVLVKFYVLIGVAVYMRLQNRVELVAATYVTIVCLWRVGTELGVDLPSEIGRTINVQHAHLVIAGMILWCIHEYGQSVPRALMFVVCMGLETAGTTMPWGSVIIVCLMIVCFCREHLPLLASRPMRFIGRCSFAVYMLHGVLSYVVIDYFAGSMPLPVVIILCYVIVIVAGESLTQMLGPLTNSLRNRLLPQSSLDRMQAKGLEIEQQLRSQADDLLDELNRANSPADSPRGHVSYH